MGVAFLTGSAEGRGSQVQRGRRWGAGREKQTFRCGKGQTMSKTGWRAGWGEGRGDEHGNMCGRGGVVIAKRK